MVKSVENLKKKKASGGRRSGARARRAYERDSYSSEPVVGKALSVLRRRRGGTFKATLRAAEFANVADPSGKKVSRVKILRVERNPANRDYERRRVITKGAFIQTELGTAKVVSRPGQDGIVNAVLVK